VVGFEDFGYEVIKTRGEALGCHLMRGMEEALVALRFDFIPALEVDGRRRAERRFGRDRGRRKALGGPAWAGLGRTSQAAVGPVWEFPKKRSWAAMVSWAENQKGYRKNPFLFFTQRFDFKSQGFKYF
jgi:hypothetical protein